MTLLLFQLVVRFFVVDIDECLLDDERSGDADEEGKVQFYDPIVVTHARHILGKNVTAYQMTDRIITIVSKSYISQDVVKFAFN